MLIPETPARPLSEAEIDAFWRDGVIVVRGLYSSKWIDTVQAALDEVCGFGDDRSAEAKKPFFRSDPYTWHKNDNVRDFALFGPTAGLVQQAFRSARVNLFCDQIFVKQAYNADRTPWHHDMTFFPLSGTQIASVWTSVDPVKAEESALEFIVGSHKWPQRFRPLGVGGIVKSVAEFDPAPDFDGARDSYRIASWDMQPGDAVLFHALTLHGSRGKPAGGLNRRAIATRWCGDDARYAPTETELQVAWRHGLQPGDPIGGPIFPQVLPHLDEDGIAGRMKGPVLPDPAIVAQNQKLAARFEVVPL